MRLRSTLSTARFIQDAVERQAISQIQTNRELTHFENSSSLCPNSGNLPHCRSPFHCALSTSNIGSVSHPAETGLRSEERRVGKECRSRRSPCAERKTDL